MPALNEVSGNQTSRLSEWIFRQEDYILTVPLQDKDEFVLDLSRSDGLLRAFASDCDRTASVAFETMYSVYRSSPRASGWLLIQSYYAAFFAAHSIMRLIGINYSQLDREHVNKVNQISKLYEVDNGIQLLNGYYECTYKGAVTKQLICKNIKSSKGGSHEAFWKHFHEAMKRLSNSILENPSTSIQQSQLVAVQIDKMCQALCHEGKNGGNWLSHVRNEVNYHHEFSVWFPYRDRRKATVDRLYHCHSLWLIDPLNIDLNIVPGTDLYLFQQTCSFIVGLCRILIEDMSSRCPNGKSYLANGSMRAIHTMAKQEISA